MRQFLKQIIFKIPFLKNVYRISLLKQKIELKKDHLVFLETADKLYLNNRIDVSTLIVGLVKDCQSIEDIFPEYVIKYNSYMKYERFLKNNNICYAYYDIYRNDWIKQAEKFDIIVWHTDSNPSEMYMAESKIYILENVLHKLCFPSFHEVWQYEDKNRAAYLYEALAIPSMLTLVTNSKKDALQLIENIHYPVITKVHIGSGSSGVKKIKDKRSLIKIIEQSFGNHGYKTIFPYFRVKNSVYVQKFIDDAAFDLRIMIIGEKLFGYYRYPKKGDFRASGAGIYEKKELPENAMRLAISIKQKMNSRLLGIDLLYSQKEQQYYVIETSLFNRIDTAEQLVVNGIPGYYDISNNDDIVFKVGRYWIQELVMQQIVEQWYKM